MVQTIAIGPRTDDVYLWCEDHGKMPDGTQRFYVINGEWKGFLSTNGDLIVHETKQVFPGQKIIWRGEVPKDVYKIMACGSMRDYNAAMRWIEEQLKHPWKSRWEQLLRKVRELLSYRLEIKLVKGKPEPQPYDYENEIPF